MESALENVATNSWLVKVQTKFVICVYFELAPSNRLLGKVTVNRFCIHRMQLSTGLSNSQMILGHELIAAGTASLMQCRERSSQGLARLKSLSKPAASDPHWSNTVLVQ